MTGNLVRWLSVAVLLLLTGCALTLGDPDSRVPIPETPPGWNRITSFGSGGEEAGAIASTRLRSAATAVSASCIGPGELVVVISDHEVSRAEAELSPTVMFDCGLGRAILNRADIAGDVPHAATLSAFIIGSAQQSEFIVGVEQAMPVARAGQ